jgi:hypothetical protein
MGEELGRTRAGKRRCFIVTVRSLKDMDRDYLVGEMLGVSERGVSDERERIREERKRGKVERRVGGAGEKARGGVLGK